MVNTENMLLWIEALESGDLRQCQGKLTRIASDGSLSHCCLGVATEVALSNGVEGITPEDYRDNANGGIRGVRGYAFMSTFGRLVETSFLPDLVARWLGLDEAQQDVTLPAQGFDVEIPASTLNDAYGTPFATIAAGLRQKYNLPK